MKSWTPTFHPEIVDTHFPPRNQAADKWVSNIPILSTRIQEIVDTHFSPRKQAADKWVSNILQYSPIFQ